MVNRLSDIITANHLYLGGRAQSHVRRGEAYQLQMRSSEGKCPTVAVVDRAAKTRQLQESRCGGKSPTVAQW